MGKVTPVCGASPKLKEPASPCCKALLQAGSPACTALCPATLEKYPPRSYIPPKQPAPQALALLPFQRAHGIVFPLHVSTPKPCCREPSAPPLARSAVTSWEGGTGPSLAVGVRRFAGGKPGSGRGEPRMAGKRSRKDWAGLGSAAGLSWSSPPRGPEGRLRGAAKSSRGECTREGNWGGGICGTSSMH